VELADPVSASALYRYWASAARCSHNSAVSSLAAGHREGGTEDEGRSTMVTRPLRAAACVLAAGLTVTVSTSAAVAEDAAVPNGHAEVQRILDSRGRRHAGRRR
jgi:hypothetical protein